MGRLEDALTEEWLRTKRAKPLASEARCVLVHARHCASPAHSNRRSRREWQ